MCQAELWAVLQHTVQTQWSRAVPLHPSWHAGRMEGMLSFQMPGKWSETTVYVEGLDFTNSFYRLFERIPHNLQSFPLHAISLFMALILISRVESLSVCLGLTSVGDCPLSRFLYCWCSAGSGRFVAVVLILQAKNEQTLLLQIWGKPFLPLFGLVGVVLVVVYFF